MHKVGKLVLDHFESEEDKAESGQTGMNDSMCTYCSDDKVFQPTEKSVLLQFVKNDGRFLASWYSTFPWITLCLEKRKVFAYITIYITSCLRKVMKHSV